MNISPKSLERRRLVFDLADQERHCPKSRPISGRHPCLPGRGTAEGVAEESGRPSHFPYIIEEGALLRCCEDGDLEIEPRLGDPKHEN
jgi:hypothetical protein